MGIYLTIWKQKNKTHTHTHIKRKPKKEKKYNNKNLETIHHTIVDSHSFHFISQL